MNEPDQDPTVEYVPGVDPTAPGWGAAREAGLPASFGPGGTFGRFRIVRVLGQGGMGQVFEVDDLDSGRRVALKILARPASSQTERSRFLREGRLAASINHPNCVYVFGTEEIEGLPAIAMELVPEGTLLDRVVQNGPLAPDEALRAILQVVAGLEAAHEAGVLHRDVKPSNCFLDGRGGVKVGDFGLSVPSEGREGETQLTVAGTFLGTPAYASPEQLHGHALDARSDIYAVGATLYYLLTGRPPFDQSNPVTLVAAILQEEPKSPALHGGVPVALARVVLRCLAKSPSARYASYAELRAALAPFVRTRQAPAELGLRLLAWIVDCTPWFLVSVGTSMLRQDLTTHLSFMLGALLTSTAYFAVTEGLWGGGVGKRLAGIRVVGPDGQTPGLGRATLRAIVFALVSAAPTLTARILSASGEAYWQFMQTAPGQLVAVSGGLLGLALFSTARRANGFAALHELASGTRVVRRQVSAKRPQMKEGAHAAGPGLREAPASVGPYRVTGAVDTRVLVGLDPALGREVWIRLGAAGDPAVPEGRRALDRATRLRWLSGRRKAEESWDAFEAPTGAPLVDVLQQPQPWGTVRHWLLDVAEELAASREDGTLPVELGMAHVWITPQGSARLIDFPVGAEGSAAPAGGDDTGRALLAAIAKRALAPQVPLPMHARSLLEDLSSERGQDLSKLIERLRQAGGEAPAVGRLRRMAHLASANVPLLVMLIPAVVSVRFILDPSVILMKELVVCVEALPTAETDAEREAIEVYIAGRFSSFSPLANVLRDPPSPARTTGLRASIAAGALRGALESADDRARLVAIYDRQLEPSPDEVREAEQLLPAKLHEKLEQIRKSSTSRGELDLLPALTAVVVTMLVALWSALHALGCPIFRGGPLVHLFGIAIVTRSGARASRLRLLGRGLLLWIPFGLSWAAAWMIHGAAKQSSLSAPLVWSTAWILALIPLAALIACVLSPTRGPHDRLAGTYLVPR